MTRWQKDADRWAEPVNSGASLNSDADAEMPSISPDGTELYLPSDRPGGLGGYDLYVSTRIATAADRTEGARR
ncbi:MAG TPA: hypothetical protein VF212_04435 [Longimicrobiales bacterium]